MNIQVFNFQNYPITFSVDGEVMINATEMAKAFGKKPNDFLRNEQTDSFITALANRYGKSRNEIVKVVQGGIQQGTWMIQKLALKYAGWLAPEFELWVYDRIEELLTTGKTEIRPFSKEETLLQAFNYLKEDVKRLEETNQRNEDTIKAQAPIVSYAQKVLSSQGGLQTALVAQEHNMTPNALNKLLKDLHVIRRVGGTWVLTTKYQDKGYAITRTYPYLDRQGNSQTSISLLWTQKGREFIHMLLSKQEEPRLRIAN